MRRLACVPVLLGCLAPVALATPTSLAQVPLADVLDKDSYCVGLGGTTYVGTHPSLGDWWLYTEVSTSHNFEFGYDLPVGAPATGVLNAKWRFDGEGDVTWAVGVQEFSLQDPGMPFPYVVGQDAHKDWTFVAGAGYDADHPLGLFAVTYAAGDHFQWFADHVTGFRRATTAGFDAYFGEDDEWDLMAAYVRDNCGGGQGVYLWLGCSSGF